MKVALCISGQMRTYIDCYDLLNKNILKPLNPDIFIHTWEGSGIIHKESVESKEGIITYDKLDELYKPKRVVIEKFESSYLEEYKGIKVPDILKEKEPNHYKGALPSSSKMYFANELKKDFEKENKFKYDIVIKLRPDLIIRKKINKNYLNEAANKDIIFFEKDLLSENFQLSDKFAFGNSEVMDYYTSVWEKIIDYWQTPLGNGNKRNYRVGERLMKYHMESSEIESKGISFGCVIKRVHIEATKQNLLRIIFKKIKLYIIP